MRRRSKFIRRVELLDIETDLDDDSDTNTDDEENENEPPRYYGKSRSLRSNIVDLNKEELQGCIDNPPTEKDIHDWSYVYKIKPLLRSNNQIAIRTQLNEKVFYLIHNVNIRYTTDKYGTAPSVLHAVMKIIFSCFQNDPIIDDQTRQYIHKLVLDYYDTVGKSSFLIGNLIKCGMWGELSLVHVRTPVRLSDIKARNLNEEIRNTLLRKGINFTDDYTYVLRYESIDQLIQYITDNEIYKDSYVPIEVLNTNKFTDPKMIQFLCDNDMIDLSKKAINIYHERCCIDLLYYLVSHDIIQVNEPHIKRIFRKKRVPKPKRKSKWNAAKHPRRSRRRRHWFAYRFTPYNRNATAKTIIPSLKLYIALIISRQICISIEKCVKDVLIQNEMYDEIIDIIRLNIQLDNGIKRVKFTTRDKMCIFTHLCKNDDIDRLHVLLDNNIITIEELHQKNTYPVDILRNAAKEIGLYVFGVLKVKYTHFDTRGLWGWRMRSVTIAKILESLRLMKLLDVLVPTSLLTTFLKGKKSIELVDLLVSEFGMKIQRGHLQYLKHYPISVFNKYSQGINFNKTAFIRNLVRGGSSSKSKSRSRRRYTWNHHRQITPRSQKLALHLISKIDTKYRLKAAQKYCTMAVISNNPDLCESLKKRYGVDIDMTIIKKSLDTIDTYGIMILNALAPPNTQSRADREIDIAKIRETFTDDEIYAILSKKPSIIDYSKETAKIKSRKDPTILRDLQLQFTPARLNDLINTFGGVSSHWDYDYRYNLGYLSCLKEDDRLLVINIIKGDPRYVENDPEYMKELVLVLFRSFAINVIKSIHTPYNTLGQFLTLKDIYTRMFESLYEGNTVYAVVEVILKCRIEFTPFLYDVLMIGCRASMHKRNLWNRQQPITTRCLKKLLEFEQRMTQPAYDKLSEMYEDLHIPKLFDQHLITLIAEDDYKPSPDEIPDNFDNYLDQANRDRDRRIIDDDSEDAYNEDRAVMADLDKAVKDAKLADDDDFINNLMTNGSDDDNIDNDSDSLLERVRKVHRVSKVRKVRKVGKVGKVC